MSAVNKTANRSGPHLIAGLSLIIGLAACNGGGGSGGGGGITLPTAPVTITQANSPQVVGAAIDTLYGGTSLPTGAQTSAFTPAPSAISAAQTVAKIGQAAVQQIVSQGAAPTIVTGAVQPTSCPFGGTKSLSSDSTSGSATFNNCSEIAGVTINGTVSVSNIVSTSSFMSADTVFNLTITTASPANTLTAMGDMHLFIDTNTFSMTMSGTRLAMGNTDPAMGNFGLLNYSIAIDSTGAFTTLTFTFASTAINGTAVFTMTSPFTYTGGMFPSSGVATITGANSTKLRLTVLGNENFVGSQAKLELSTDGGLIYAAPTYHTWADISSLI